MQTTFLFIILILQILFITNVQSVWGGTSCTTQTWDNCICDGAECIGCENGYWYAQYQDSTKNHCCSLDCLQCEEHSDGTICTICADQSKYYSVGDSECISCDENCVQCNTGGGCDTCEEFFYVDGSEACVACPDNCDECSLDGTLTCTKCEDGYYHESDTKCLECPDNCITCHLEEVSLIIRCDSCPGEGKLDKWGQCSSSCPDNCQECEMRGSTSFCLRCDSVGLGQGIPQWQVNQQGQCEKCPDYCHWCRYDSDYKIICENNVCNYEGSIYSYGVMETDQQYSYYKANDGTCKICMDKCQQCSDNGEVVECEVCDIGMEFLNQNMYSDPQEFYDLTKYGYYFDNGEMECKKCPDTCQECEFNIESDKLECTKCFNAFEVLNQDEELGSPSIGSPYFKFRGEQHTIQNFGISKNKDSCVKCPDNCFQCEEEKCTLCISGYGVNSKGKCDACSVKNCQTCTTSTKYCDSCQTGYYKDVDYDSGNETCTTSEQILSKISTILVFLLIIMAYNI